MAPLPKIEKHELSPTVAAIYEAYEAEARNGLGVRLHAGSLGNGCERALWYTFRWATAHKALEGRVLRLFDTGKREEERVVRDLRRTGATVLDIDPETGKQWRVTAHGNHFAGMLDAIAIGLREAPDEWLAVEIKTHKASEFKRLLKLGVEKSHHTHWAQLQLYMALKDLKRGAYVAVCKDDDRIEVKLVDAVPAAGAALVAKAKRIIDAQRPPDRVADSADAFLCRFCPHQEVCHNGAAPQQNCRTCLHSTPAEGGWLCERHGHMLSVQEQEAGCGDHLFIPDFVPGKVVAVGDDWIEYELNEGGIWRNG